MNEGKDLTLYLEEMEKSDKTIIAFPNIDRKLYPELFTKQRVKFLEIHQKNVMELIHGVSQEEMENGFEEVFIDFTEEEDKETPQVVSKTDPQTTNRENEPWTDEMDGNTMISASPDNLLSKWALCLSKIFLLAVVV